MWTLSLSWFSTLVILCTFMKWSEGTFCEVGNTNPGNYVSREVPASSLVTSYF